MQSVKMVSKDFLAFVPSLCIASRLQYSASIPGRFLFSCGGQFDRFLGKNCYKSAFCAGRAARSSGALRRPSIGVVSDRRAASSWWNVKQLASFRPRLTAFQSKKVWPEAAVFRQQLPCETACNGGLMNATWLAKWGLVAEAVDSPVWSRAAIAHVTGHGPSGFSMKESRR